MEKSFSFRNLEPWEQEFVINHLDENESIYVEYNINDLLDGFKLECQQLRHDRDEGLKYINRVLNELVGKSKTYIGKIEISERYLSKDEVVGILLKIVEILQRSELK